MTSRFLTEQIIGTSFRFYTDDEIRKISVKRITNPTTFDTFNHPTDEGLYDRALGPTEFGVLCPTCSLPFQECPGHLGHVELNVSIYNPTLFSLLYRLLRLKCYSCHHLRISATRSRILAIKLMFLDLGKIQEAMEFEHKLVSKYNQNTPDTLLLQDLQKSGKQSSSSSSGSKKKKNKMGDDNDGDDTSTNMVDYSSPPMDDIERQQQILRDTEFDCIQVGGNDVGCGLGCNDGMNQYSQQIRNYRSSIISEYLRSFPTKGCENCNAPALAIRKDGYSKIFQKPLPKRTMVAMNQLGIHYRSATAILRARARREATKAQTLQKHKHHQQQKHNNDDDDDNEEDDNEDLQFDDDNDDDYINDEGIADDLMGYDQSASHEADGDDDDEKNDEDKNVKPRFMPASEVEAQMQLLWEKDCQVLRRVFLPIREDSSLYRRRSNLRNSKQQSLNKISSVPGSTTKKQTQQPGADGYKYLFLHVLPVPPPRFRPPTRLGEQQFEHPQNVYLNKIIRLNDTLFDLGLGNNTNTSNTNNIRNGVDLKQALSAWMELQNCVNGLMDSTKMQTGGAADPANGIRQLLEKKEGMFRKNMMGKRVNFAARTVISPDPFLRVDQVGVPLRFAKRLSYKQAVTPWNVHALRKAVVNGPDIWPGATHVEDENGVVIDLTTKTAPQREAIAKQLLKPSHDATSPVDPLSGVPAITHQADVDHLAATAAAAANTLNGVGIKRVWRHLQDGDIVLMNRQPTLHKPSVMAHRARVMKAWSTQQILRFHYANCKTYNADFDGDEMNMHLPQDEIGRSEAYNIVATDYQYLSGTGGGPLRGLIQDHNGIAAILSKRDTLLTRDQYCQLVFAALQALPQYGIGMGGGGKDLLQVPDGIAYDIPLLEPAILKPRKLYTGKQVVTALLLALTAHLPTNARLFHADGKAKIGDGIWGAGNGKKDIIPVGESAIIIRSSELLCGVLDKNALGNSSYGLIHNFYEAYGPGYAGALLSAFGRLLTVYEQQSAMTCGMSDLVLTTEAETTRYKLLQEGKETGAIASAGFAHLKAPEHNKSVLESPAWDRNVRRRIRDTLRGGAAGADVTGNAAAAFAVQLDNAVKSSTASTHSKIINACLPYGLLKPFPANQFSLMVQSGAKGSLVNHAMIAVGLGQQELEGRRVPMMTSGKTLPCFPAFDPAPRSGGYIADRFLTGLRPQDYFFHCMSGREGLVDTAVKTSRSGYLQRCLVKHLEALRVGYDGTVRDSDGGIVQYAYGEDGMDVLNTPYMGGKDDQLSFLLRNNAALSNTYAMTSNNFKNALRTMNAETATQAYKSLTSVRNVLKNATSMSVTEAIDSLQHISLSIGDKVELLLPTEMGQETWPQYEADKPNRMLFDVSVDGRTLFTPGKLCHSTKYVTATVINVRDSDEEQGKAGIPVVDLRFIVAQPIPLVQRRKLTSMSTAPKQSGNIDLEMEPDEPETVTSSGFTLYGTGYVNYNIKAKKVPMFIIDKAQAWIVIKPRLPDPIPSKFSPSTHFGAVSEAFADRVHSYIARNPLKLVKDGASPSGTGILSSNAFTALLYVKALRSLAHPGEPVGVIAAQSIGEPSTQMTLNTFHLAGGGGVNVTLGIPRLREIVMTASPNPKTPSMFLPISKSLEAADKDGIRAREMAGKISRILSPLPMSDLLALSRSDGGIRVSETLRTLGGMSGSGEYMWVRQYAVRLFITDPEAIQAAFGMSFRDVADAVGRTFTPRLLQIITADLRRAQRAAGSSNTVDIGVEKVRGNGVRRTTEDNEGSDNDNEEIIDRSSSRGHGKGKAALKDIEEGEGLDDEDDDDEDGPSKDEGVHRSKKEMSGYDDVDEEDKDDEDDDGMEGKVSKRSGKTTVKSDSDDDDDDDDDDSSSTTSSSSSSSTSSSGSSSSTSSSSSGSSSSSSVKKSTKKKVTIQEGTKKEKSKGRLTSKRMEADRSVRHADKHHKLPFGEFSVDVSSTLKQDPRFGGIIACVQATKEYDDETMVDADGSSSSSSSSSTSSSVRNRKDTLTSDPWVEVTIVFPASARKVLMLSSAERAASSALVRNIKGVTRALVAKTKIGGKGDDRTCVFTEGVNLPAMWNIAATLNGAASNDKTLQGSNHEIVDINRLSTNDIAAVLRIYGVEAARACIVREMRAVFDAYGIGVDIRHLYLIADYMTQGGGFRPMNRMGIEAHGSPYLKMSFETTTKFLTDALLSGEHERMVSPSARIVMGRIVDAGTGSFDLWQDTSYAVRS